MKFTLAYYLLLAYSFALLKPIMPLVQDTVAHFFWEAKHIASVHAHKGKNHVHQEVGDSQKAANNTDDSALKNSEPVSLHLVFSGEYDFFYPTLSSSSPSLQWQHLQSPYQLTSYPPPKQQVYSC